MTGTTRRALIGAIPALAVAPAFSAPLQPTVQENSALIALSQQTAEIEATYRDAVAAFDEMMRIWSPQWPLAPEACCRKHNGGDLERDILGSGLQRKGEKKCWSIMTAADLEQRRDRALELLAKDDRRKRSYGRKFREHWSDELAQAEIGLALLPGYHAECARIKRESNADAVGQAVMDAAAAIYRHAREVLAQPSLTKSGVKIKADACAAIGRMRSYDRHLSDLRDLGAGRTSLAVMLAEAVIAAAA